MKTPLFCSDFPDGWATCRRVATRSRSNFVSAFRFFPPEKRAAATILYAFMRLTDDLVDSPEPETLETSDSSKTTETERRERLDAWRTASKEILTRVEADVFNGLNDINAFIESVSTDFFDSTALRTFPNRRERRDAAISLGLARRRFPIPLDAILATVDGMALDVGASTRVATLSEAFDYCDKAATAVGLALLGILGTTEPLDSPELLAAARGCGLAFQWTNFLRDVAEDCARNRVYFPTSDFADVGIGVETLFAAVQTREIAPILPLLGVQIERTAAFYREAEPLFAFVSPDSRRALRAMFDVYRAIFRKIAADPRRVLAGRVRLTFGEKVRALFHRAT